MMAGSAAGREMGRGGALGGGEERHWFEVEEGEGYIDERAFQRASGNMRRFRNLYEEVDKRWKRGLEQGRQPYRRQDLVQQDTVERLQSSLRTGIVRENTAWNSREGWSKEAWSGLPNLWDAVDWLVMRDKGTIARHVPVALRSLHAKCARMILDTLVMYGNQRNEDSEHSKAWAIYFLYGVLCLQEEPGMKISRLHSQQKKARRMLMLLEGHWDELLIEAVQRAKDIKDWRSRQVERDEGEAGKIAREQTYLDHMKNGKWANALDTILQKTTLKKEYSEDVKKVLLEKLPKVALPTGGANFGVERQQAKAPKFDASDIRLYISRHGDKAAGLSGIRPSHWRDAYTAPQDQGLQPLTEKLARVAEMLAMGRHPDKITPYLTGGMGGIMGEKRLFVAGDTLQRMADALTNRQWRLGGEKLTHNVGVGVGAAMDVFRHWVLVEADRGRQEFSDWVMVEVDAKNMFHELSREHLIRITAKRAPIMTHGVLKLLQPSFISMFRGKCRIECTSGTIIGGGNSATPASMVMDEMLDEVLKWAEQKSVLMKTCSYIDNLVFMCRLGNVREIFNCIVEKGRPLGLKFLERIEAPNKLHCWQEGTLAEAKKQFRHGWRISCGFQEEGIQEIEQELSQGECTGAVKIVGVFYGNDNAVAKMVMNKVNAVLKMVDELSMRADPLGFLLLLRTCVIPKLDFLMRTTDPYLFPVRDGRNVSLDEHIAMWVMRAIGGQKWAENKLGDQRTKNIIVKQFMLPRRMGGWGLRSHSEADVIAANLAGLYAVMEQKREISILSDFARHIQTYNEAVNERERLSERCEDTLTQIKERQQEAEKQGESVIQLGDRKSRVAKRLSGAIRNKLEQGLRESLGEDMQRKKTHITEQIGAGQFLWSFDVGCITAEPRARSRSRGWSSQHAAYNMRRMLYIHDVHGLEMDPLWHQGDQRCHFAFKKGGHCEKLQDVSLRHSEVACLGVRGANKHFSLMMAVVKGANELGLVAEPKALIPETKNHPDLTISYLLEHELLVDVANVVTDDSPNSTSTNKLDMTWNKKVKKYEDVCRNSGLAFLPCITSVHGGFCRRTVETLIRKMAEKLRDRDDITLSAAEKRIMLRFQTAVLKQIAQNGMDFMTRKGFTLPQIVELADQREKVCKLA